MVTNLTESQLLVNLTNIDGLFDRDPRINEDAEIIRIVKKVDRRVEELASTIPGFLGTGGMASKVRAAQKVALAGVPTVIANGLKPGILKHIFTGKEEGTLFLPRRAALSSRKHWIAFTKAPKGVLIVDQGAERALMKKGKSLLPSGIRGVKGRFSQGNSVLLVNEKGNKVAIGMVNYQSTDIRKIMGAKTSEIESLLGAKHDDEVIHRDNLILVSEIDEGRDVVK
jgi:glutamate 5-kinase